VTSQTLSFKLEVGLLESHQPDPQSSSGEEDPHREEQIGHSYVFEEHPIERSHESTQMVQASNEKLKTVEVEPTCSMYLSCYGYKKDYTSRIKAKEGIPKKVRQTGKILRSLSDDNGRTSA
jgi:hypothetical protein